MALPSVAEHQVPNGVLSSEPVMNPLNDGIAYTLVSMVGRLRRTTRIRILQSRNFPRRLAGKTFGRHGLTKPHSARTIVASGLTNPNPILVCDGTCREAIQYRLGYQYFSTICGSFGLHYLHEQ